MSDREASMERIIRVLLQQVKRGGPSNFVEVAGHYLDPEDFAIFQELVSET